MDRSRKQSREGREKTFQYKSRQEALLDEELTEDKLAQLLAFIGELDILLREMPNFNAGSNCSESVNEVKVKPRRTSTLSCTIGCTGTFHRQNRHCILRGRPAVVQLLDEVDD